MTELLDVLGLLMGGGAKVAPKLGATAARVSRDVHPLIQEQLYGRPFKDTERFIQPPRWEGMPFHHKVSSDVPEAARELGYDIPVFHSTNSSIPFNEFKIPERELGIHTGTPTAALTRGDRLGSSGIIPLLMRSQNPLVTHDMNIWTPSKMADHLYQRGWRDPLVKEAKGVKDRFFHPDYGPEDEDVLINQTLLTKRAEEYDNIQRGLAPQMRQLLQNKGYDSVKYNNGMEDPGSWSYMALNPNQLRVPWAKFDPSKVNSGNIWE